MVPKAFARRLRERTVKYGPAATAELRCCRVQGSSGATWVRVQHKDTSQKLVPFLQESDWNTALPDDVVVADYELGAIAVSNIAHAITRLKNLGFEGPVVGRWLDVRGLTMRRSSPPAQKRN